ncbi:TonB-dependent receptor plug domain-containing protein [Phenylobacterium kunshanense]|uniref:TonB-dependent receptor n=1 Tax=Phenylobacterium kunshanense TaxID=1445034 RepID=A0A328BFT3_9CAUL|nr:TonB-dependent receptor [Phenylobacterium kunshanense]RAK66332.1 TonB-dependent receptor [Phenylobacterium kunshanense]
MGPWVMLAAAAAPPAAVEALPAAPQPAAAERGVTAYPPAFFADVRPVSAYDMVVRLPGFTFDKGSTVRGLEGSGGNVLIDGKPPLAKNDTLEDILRRIPAASVARVEVIRGGAPGIDMEGRSVVANVVRGQQAGFRGAVQPYFDAVYDGRFLPGVRFEGQWTLPGGRNAEFSQTFSTGHFPNDENGDGGRIRYAPDGRRLIDSEVDADQHGHRIQSTGAFSTPLMGGQLSLTGSIQFNYGALELYDNDRIAGGVEYEKSPNKRGQHEAGIRFTRRLNEKVGMEALLFQQVFIQDLESIFRGPTLTRDFALDRKSYETVGRLQFNITPAPGMRIEAGGEGAYNRLDSQTALAVNGRPVPLPAGDVLVEEVRGQAILRGTWRLSPRLTLEAGARQEYSRVTSAGDVTLEKSLTYLKPRAALTWTPGEGAQMRLRIEREVGQLNFDDFVASPNVASTGVVVAGNPDLTPLQAWVYEATVERSFWKDGSIVLTYRHFDLSDVVDRAPILGPGGVILADAPGNIGSGRKTEVQAGLTAPLDRLGLRSAQLKGQVTWRDTKVLDPLTRSNRQISTLHPVDWEVHFSQALPQWRMTWGLDLLGGFRERVFRLTEIETKKVSPYLILYTEHRLRPDVTLRIEANGINMRDAKRIREVYAGPRSLGQLVYTDVRDLEWGGNLMVRLRKTFGR